MIDGFERFWLHLKFYFEKCPEANCGLPPPKERKIGLRLMKCSSQVSTHEEFAD